MIAFLPAMPSGADLLNRIRHPIDAVVSVAVWTGWSWRQVGTYIGAWALLVLFFYFASRLERIRPIERHDTPRDRDEVWMDYKLALANHLMRFVSVAIATKAQIAIGTALGGGRLIHLEATTPAQLVVCSFTYLFIKDLYTYWVHRLSHMIPALWALHSFHHSAERITVVTGARHIWLQNIAYIPFATALALLITVPPETVVLGNFFFYFPEMFTHLNYKLPYGRLSYFLNTPQFHRIHHSVRPEHMNKNFAATLPVIDFIFGTAVMPGPDEYPATGLVPSDRPRLIDGVLWPVRGVVRSWMAKAGSYPAAGHDPAAVAGQGGA